MENGLYWRLAKELGEAVSEYAEENAITAEDLARAFGYRLAAARRILAELVKLGRLVRVHSVYFAVAA